jgi:hypothetical protein
VANIRCRFLKHIRLGRAMKSKQKSFICSVFVAALALDACAYPPPFDIATVNGEQTVTPIVKRIECELLDTVRDEYNHREFLIQGDYDVIVNLSLDVTDRAGLSPTVSYLNPVAMFTFGGSANLNGSRDQNFSWNLKQFSLREMYTGWKYDHRYPYCDLTAVIPLGGIPLEGDLGIRERIATLAALSPDLEQSGQQQFGGSVEFVITKAITALGPTWTLTHFVGPGPLGSASRVNNDKVTFAFATGPNAGKPMPKGPVTTNPYNAKAYLFLQQLINQQITSQLFVLQPGLFGLR